MRVLIDLLGAPENSGGMRTYAEEFVWEWWTTSQDEVHIAGGKWIAEQFDFMESANVHVLPDGGLARILSQWISVGRLGRRLEVDAVHSLSPIVTPFGPTSATRSNTVHDWRHRRRPSEFSAFHHIYRRTWRTTTAAVDLSVQISNKTYAETEVYVPGVQSLILAPSGTDHARRWTRSQPGATDYYRILTFGHANNKRPDLIMEALPRVLKTHPQARLLILGAEGHEAISLQQRAAELSCSTQVRLPGFVSKEEYRHEIQCADAIILTSSDEGFGLPIAEAAYFGIPVITSRENQLSRVHDWPLIECDMTAATIAEAILAAAKSGKQRHGLSGGTWASTVAIVRNAIANHSGNGSDFRGDGPSDSHPKGGFGLQ